MTCRRTMVRNRPITSRILPTVILVWFGWASATGQEICEVCGCSTCASGFVMGNPEGLILVTQELLDEFAEVPIPPNPLNPEASTLEESLATLGVVAGATLSCSFFKTLAQAGFLPEESCIDKLRLNPTLRETCGCPPTDRCNGVDTGVLGCLPCFSSDTLVVVKGKGNVPMKSLVPGDMVHVGDAVFESIYAFGHRTESLWVEFLQVSVQGIDKPIELTETHMIFVRNGDETTTKAIPAAMLQPDDRLVYATDGTSRRVVRIRKVTKRGLYAPLTYSGKVAVNGVMASVYPAVNNNEASFWGVSMQIWMHLGQGPHRLLCKLGGMSLCVAAAADTEMVLQDEPVEDDAFGGMSPMMVRSVKLLQWIGNQRSFIQVLVGFLLAVMVIISMAIEFVAEERAVTVVLAVGLLTTVGYSVSKIKKVKTL